MITDGPIDRPTRRCTRCGVTKHVDEFQLESRETGELQHWCRACMAQYKHDWYLRNRDHQVRRVVENRRRSARENQDRAWAYLAEHGCVDCGESDPVVLQFDHVREKRNNVSAMLRTTVEWPLILAEIEKCEVRCGNCHRRKTADERGILERKRAFWKPGVGFAQTTMPDN